MDSNNIQEPHQIRFAVEGDLGAARTAIDRVNKIDPGCIARLEANEVVIDLVSPAAYSKFYHWALLRK